MRMHPFISKVRCLVIAAVVFAGPSSLLRGDEPSSEPFPEPRWTLGFYFENDLFYDTDRYYTNGAKVSLISPNFNRLFHEAAETPGILRPLLRRLPLHDPEGHEIWRTLVLTVGQNLYTPEDIITTEFQPGDRPYAAWLYTGIGLHHQTARWQDALELNIGVVGPWAFGEQIQNFVHRARGFELANGWEHQIGNEVVFNIVYERRWRRALFGNTLGWGADLLGHGGGSLGTMFTYLNAGGGFRFGWNLPEDFGASLIRLAGDTHAPATWRDPRLRGERPFGVHLFLTVDGRLLLRDLTLDGNTFQDSPSVDREWLTGDLSGGVAVILGPWKASYAATFRTKTFQTGRQQTFGSINVSLTF